MQMRISSISSNAHLGASSLYNLSPLFCQMLNKSPEEKMGCTSSVYALGRKKKVTISEVVLYVPSVTIPVQSDPPRALKGEIPKEPLDRLTCLRNQIVLVAEDTDGSSMTELRRALEEYMSLLIGFTKKEHGLEYLVEFKWKKLDDYGKEEFCVANSWFELLCVVHLMAMLTLSEANTLLISKDSGSGVRVVSSVLEFIHKIVREKLWIYCFKASGYLEFCVKNILVPIPPDIKNRLPKDLQDGVLEATSIQALGQNLILDKGNEPSCHVSAVCSFLAAEELLAESKKACLSFCLAPPITRSPPLWGTMKHLQQKIPEVASRKSQMYGYLLEQEKAPQALPDLPDFQLSLGPDDYELPEIDLAWNRDKWEIVSQALKEYLNDGENDIETE